MRNSLDSASFREYGAVYDVLDDALCETMERHPRHIKGHRLQNLFFRFDCNSYIEIQSGNGILLVSHDPHTKPVAEFFVTRRFCVKPGVYFSILSSSPEMQVDILLPVDYSMELAALNRPYQSRLVCPQIRVTEILGYYYRIRNSEYFRPEESHPFYELVYVDSGSMRSVVDGKAYTIREKEIMIYGPGQKHVQSASGEEMLSYVTVRFQMQENGRVEDEDWRKILLNRVFPYQKKTYSLIKSLVQENSGGVPYMDSLMVCMLTEILVRLLQSEYVEPSSTAGNIVRQNYQDELFGRVISYIEKRICEPLTVADICQAFSLSRSSVQLLFKNAVNQSPKRYISDLKLERSCQLLRENKYTISEITQKLGYSSIHYFSNAFHQKYHVSPSEYAKRIY